MRPSVSLIIALLATGSLAGCAGEEPLADPNPGTGGESPGGNETTDPGNQTGAENEPGPSGDNATNTPPVANLTANVTIGSAPLEVNFTMSASDDEGDNLTWSLDADGDGVIDAEGSELPASFAFTFADVGNFTARLTVADAENSSPATLNVTVLDAAPTSEPWTRSGSADLSCPGCIVMSEADVTPGCVSLATETNELDCVFFELPADAEGRMATVTGDGLDGDWVEYGFLTACAPEADVLLAGAGYAPSPMAVPAGAGCVVLADSVFPGTAFSISLA